MNALANTQRRRGVQRFVTLFEVSVALIVVPLLVHGLLTVNALPIA